MVVACERRRRRGGGLVGESSQRQPGSQPLKTWLTKPPTTRACHPPHFLPPPPTSNRHECMSNHVLANARAQLRTGSGEAHTGLGTLCAKTIEEWRGGERRVSPKPSSPQGTFHGRHAAGVPVQASEIHVTTHAAVPSARGYRVQATTSCSGRRSEKQQPPHEVAEKTNHPPTTADGWPPGI